VQSGTVWFLISTVVGVIGHDADDSHGFGALPVASKADDEDRRRGGGS
jgi:hypothetical protein